MRTSNTAALLVAVLCVAVPQQSFAQDTLREAAIQEQFLKAAGSVEGAIWYFTLSPLPRSTPERPDTIRGAYRVSDLKVYQAAKTGEEWTVEIGVSKPLLKEKKTAVEFTLLRGLKGPKQWAEPLKGKALLSLKEFGKLEGEFVDSNGFKWKMLTTRIRE